MPASSRNLLLGSILVFAFHEQKLRAVHIKDLIAENEVRIRNGMQAYALLEKIRGGDRSEGTMSRFEQVQADLGFGLLLKRFTPNVVDATEAQIKQAARDTIPNVAAMFWVFRIMVGLGFFFLLIMALAFYYCARRMFEEKRWLLKILFYNLPLPWIAMWAGWFVAEYGRQPWTIGEVLPTFISVSSLTTGDLIGSIIGFVLLYTVLLVAEIYLMVKFSRLGPSSLHTGRYYFERKDAEATTA